MKITITCPRSVGKTTIAKIIAKELKLKYHSSDEIGEQHLKKYGGLDKAIKSGIIGKFIKDSSYGLIREIYKKDNFVFDLSGGSVSSKKYAEASERVRKTAKDNSIIIGLLPSKNIDESVKFLFEREKERIHFKDINKKKLLGKTKKDYKKFPVLFKELCNFIIYVKGKTSYKIVNEVINNIKLKSNIILFGETHGFMKKESEYIEDVIKKFNPQVILYESLEDKKLDSSNKIKSFLKKSNKKKFSLISHYGELEKVIKLAEKYNLPILGLDLKNMGRNKPIPLDKKLTMSQIRYEKNLLKKRESRQVKIIKNSLKKYNIILVVVGAYHLRKNSPLREITKNRVIFLPKYNGRDIISPERIKDLKNIYRLSCETVAKSKVLTINDKDFNSNF